MKRTGNILAFLLGMSVSFNTLALQGLGRAWSAGLIVSVIFMLYSLQYAKCLPILFRRFKWAFWLPCCFFLLVFFVNFAHSESAAHMSLFPSTMFMCWGLFILVMADGLVNKNHPQMILNGLAIGTIILSVLFLNQIGIEVNLTREGERFSMFGSNENVLGIFQSIGIAIVAYSFIIRDCFHLHRWRFVFIAALILQVSMLVATGSRTAFVILVLQALAISFVSLRTSKHNWVRMTIVVMGVLTLYWGVNSLVESDSVLSERIASTVSESDTGGRSDIWIRLLPYVGENPFFGVGETGYLLVSMEAIGRTYVAQDGMHVGFSPHNVALELLVKYGFVGFSLFLTFWLKTFWMAYRQDRCGNSLALILVIPLVMVIMSGQMLSEKYAWLIYAYMIINGYSPKEIKKLK